eukprot:scaffold60105_cov30-Tisochrysis_lutea.AAC.1
MSVSNASSSASSSIPLIVPQIGLQSPPRWVSGFIFDERSSGRGCLHFSRSISSAGKQEGGRMEHQQQAGPREGDVGDEVIEVVEKAARRTIELVSKQQTTIRELRSQLSEARDELESLRTMWHEAQHQIVQLRTSRHSLRKLCAEAVGMLDTELHDVEPGQTAGDKGETFASTSFQSPPIHLGSQRLCSGISVDGSPKNLNSNAHRALRWRERLRRELHFEVEMQNRVLSGIASRHAADLINRSRSVTSSPVATRSEAERGRWSIGRAHKSPVQWQCP